MGPIWRGYQTMQQIYGDFVGFPSKKVPNCRLVSCNGPLFCLGRERFRADGSDEKLPTSTSYSKWMVPRPVI